MALTSERIEVPSDPGAQYALSFAERWGDGLPLLPPTDAAIESLLETSPYPADHALCVPPPTQRVATLELIAIDAAMAGVEPAAFPFVVAALEAMAEPEWNAAGLTTTTSSVCPMLLVNGPSRDALGIDCRASCIGEWEARSPWPSLAERRGFRADQDVVTVHGGKGTMPLADINNDDPLDLLALIARSIAYPLANLYMGGHGAAEVVIAINPMWAERFGRAFPEVAGLQQFVYDHAWQPIDLWPAGSGRILRDAGRVDDAGRVHLLEQPEQLVPFVCGGLGSLHAIVLPSFGQSKMQSKAVLRR